MSAYNKGFIIDIQKLPFQSSKSLVFLETLRFFYFQLPKKCQGKTDEYNIIIIIKLFLIIFIMTLEFVFFYLMTYGT